MAAGAVGGRSLCDVLSLCLSFSMCSAMIHQCAGFHLISLIAQHGNILFVFHELMASDKVKGVT